MVELLSARAPQLEFGFGFCVAFSLRKLGPKSKASRAVHKGRAVATINDCSLIFT